MDKPPTTSLTVPAGERDILRLFSLNMPAEQARFLSEPGAVDQLLGVTDLDPTQIEIIALHDLEELGLAGYLTDGCAIPASQISRAALEALTGYVLLLRSRTFGGRALTLKPTSQLALVASYTEPATDWSADPMTTSTIARRSPPRAARSRARRIGLALFSVMMTLIALALYLVLT